MRPLSRIALLIAATTLAAPTYAAPAVKSVPIPTLVRQVTIPHSSFTPGQRAHGHRPRGPQGAGRRGQHVVQCRVQGRAQGQDRLRPSVRASDVQRHRRICPATSSNISQQIGATDYNGTTSFDRTNYFQTVPDGRARAGAVHGKRPHGPSARRGHPGACSITSAASSRTRSARATTSPAGWSFYEVLEKLFPEGHPYHHTTIGSMADLDAASLADVKQWFRDKYGPNNAVLVLAGDIDAAEARPLVEKYFGAHRARPGQQSGRRPTCRRWRRPSRS